MLNHMPKQGEFYRLKKNGICQIISIAEHCETQNCMVVFQILEGTFSVYVDGLEEFLEKVEGLCQSGNQEGVDEISKNSPLGDEKGINPMTLRFLEADTYDDKINVLMKIREKATKQNLEDIALSLDLVLNPESISDTYEAIINHLRTLAKYEGRRVR